MRHEITPLWGEEEVELQGTKRAVTPWEGWRGWGGACSWSFCARSSFWRGAEGIERPEREDFEHIYHLYSRRLYSLCLRMAGNIAEAEDLTQQAFLQAYKKLDMFRGESSFYTWLHRSVVNVVLMRPREKGGLKEDSREDLKDPDNRSSAWHGIKGRSSDATALMAIDRVDVERTLNQLPSRFRTVLVLHDVESNEHVEISGLLGCSMGTSKAQLHRARLRMRKLTRAATWQKSA